MSCLWRAVNRVYCNKQHCTVHVCSVTWRKSLLLFGALNRPVRSAQEAMLGRGRAVRSVKRLPGEHGWGWCPGEAQVPALGGEKGIRAAPAGPTRSTDSCSQPWNSSSETRVIKECTNCESPLKKIKSSVPPAPTRGCSSPGALELAEPGVLRRARVPARGQGSLLLEAAWGSGEGGRRWGKHGCPKSRGPAEPIHLPLWGLLPSAAF